MVAFKNIYEKYISVDEVAGGQTTLRGDSETVGFNERFWIRVQHEYKHKAGEEDRKKTGKTRPQEIDEVGSNHKFQAWGAGRSVVSVDDSKALKKARKEGALSEALLDRRIKLKRYVFSPVASAPSEASCKCSVLQRNLRAENVPSILGNSGCQLYSIQSFSGTVHRTATYAAAVLCQDVAIRYKPGAQL
ncbi:hypothetical protein RhiXN_01870 [Rhizoctonia solani]|uniref:Uncharacterized protein n=1 Tax=Rhizoctonia solani TaxID=456999 RepID=A0A8H8P8S0_9AGAM|nr:uncharacterized protein RhiXN_01870 [Rhizoctonia solani]QRW27275.1 hypothetical protein RhiXN_01870 [Rhizoctonia solani]